MAEATAKEIGRLSLAADVTIDEAAMVAASLAALTGGGRETAVETLRAMAEEATRQAGARGVA